MSLDELGRAAAEDLHQHSGAVVDTQARFASLHRTRTRASPSRSWRSSVSRRSPLAELRRVGDALPRLPPWRNAHPVCSESDGPGRGPDAAHRQRDRS